MKRDHHSSARAQIEELIGYSAVILFGMLSIAAADELAPVPGDGSPPDDLTVVDVIRYTETAAANPANEFDAVGIVHNGMLDACRAEIGSALIIGIDAAVSDLAFGCIRGLLAEEPIGFDFRRLRGDLHRSDIRDLRFRPIFCICINPCECPCDDLGKKILELPPPDPPFCEGLAFPDDDNGIPLRLSPIVVPLPVPEVVIEEVLDELEDTPLTVEAVKARAADALGEEFIQFEPYFDQILELLTAVGTNELTLGEFYEEMTLLEREISSSAFVSDFVRDLLLQTASVARHGLFAALVSETELTSEGAEDGTGSEYFEGLGVLAVYGCVIGGIVGGLPGCVGGAIGAVLLAIDIG